MSLGHTSLFYITISGTVPNSEIEYTMDITNFRQDLIESNIDPDSNPNRFDLAVRI